MGKTIAEAMKDRYHRLRAEGKCPRCATKLKKAERGVHTYCADCRAYLAERAVERAKGNVLREIAPAGEGGTVAETKAALRARARERGLCGICALRKPRKGYATCDVCRERAADAYLRRKAAKKGKTN